MKLDRERLLLYAVTDRRYAGEPGLEEHIRQALEGGVTLLQLREKDLDREAFIEEARRVKAICRRFGVPLIINDQPEVALAVGADGVHVGAGDRPVREIRRLAGENFIIGATAKTVEQARQAEADGADYLGVGAVFPSPTKENALRITRERLREICAAVKLPAVAIGGINRDNMAELAGTGIAGVAVVSALFGAEDVQRAAGELREAARRIVGPAERKQP